MSQNNNVAIIEYTKNCLGMETEVWGDAYRNKQLNETLPSPAQFSLGVQNCPHLYSPTSLSTRMNQAIISLKCLLNETPYYQNKNIGLIWTF